MNINIFSVFKYPLSPDYRNEIEHDIRNVLSKHSGTNAVLKADLHIKDEKHPKDSKVGYYKATLSVHLHKKKPVVLTQKGACFGKCIQKLLDNAVVTLEKSKNKKVQQSKVENHKFKRSNRFTKQDAAETQ